MPEVPKTKGWSMTRKVMVTSLLVSSFLLACLLLTVWLGGEPPPLSVDYDGFD